MTPKLIEHTLLQLLKYATCICHQPKSRITELCGACKGRLVCATQNCSCRVNKRQAGSFLESTCLRAAGSETTTDLVDTCVSIGRG